MPAVLRRINRIFRRNNGERNNSGQGNNNNNSSSSGQGQRHINLARNMVNHRGNHHRNNHNESNTDNTGPIKLRSSKYQRQSDGSVTLQVTLDKDHVECCVCMSSMTEKIYRCKGNGTNSNNNNNNKDVNDDKDKDSNKIICHNICGSCEWTMRRLKSGNGHTKEMQCPMCKVRGPFIRNRALERQLSELLEPCKYNKFGCDQQFFPWDEDTKKLHEKHLCIYQSVDCPFCYQTIPGGRCNFIEHLVKASKNKQIHQSQSNANNNNNNDNSNNNNHDDEEMEDRDESMIDNNPEIEPVDDDEDDIIHGMEIHHESDAEAMIAGDDDDDDEEDEDLNHVEIEEDEKESLNNDNDIDLDNMGSDENIDSDNYVPPCLLNWMEAGSAMDSQHNEKFIISNNEDLIIKNGINQFIVNYNLGVVICFIAPSVSTGGCYSVYAISISPRHDLGGNSRIYIQYYDDDKLNKFMETEQNMGLITKSLVRPVQNTLILTLGRLHPTTLRKLFNSYPENNPFIEEEKDQIMINTKKKSLGNNSQEMKENDDNDNDDEMRDLSPDSAANANLNNNHNRNRNNNNNDNMDPEKKMDEEVMVKQEEKTGDIDNNNDAELDEDDVWELQEHEPKAMLGDSPCTPFQCGYIFGGFGPQRMENIGIRIFTLEESLKVGAIIDARDFTGKWYQAEIISVQDFDGIEYVNLDCDNDDYLEIRKAKIHYLGYSQNYDEWLNVDTDSHRIAQRGTFTIGPDLRAIRRNTTNLNHHHSSSGNNNNSNNNNNNSNNNNNHSYLNRRSRSSRNNHNNQHSQNNNNNNHRSSHHIIQRLPVVDIDDDEDED